MSWVLEKAGDVIEGGVEAVLDVGRDIDDFVNEEIPGGWAGAAALAAGGYALAGGLSGAGAAAAAGSEAALAAAAAPELAMGAGAALAAAPEAALAASSFVPSVGAGLAIPELAMGAGALGAEGLAAGAALPGLAAAAPELAMGAGALGAEGLAAAAPELAMGAGSLGAEGLAAAAPELAMGAGSTAAEAAIPELAMGAGSGATTGAGAMSGLPGSLQTALAKLGQNPLQALGLINSLFGGGAALGGGTDRGQTQGAGTNPITGLPTSVIGPQDNRAVRSQQDYGYLNPLAANAFMIGTQR